MQTRIVTRVLVYHDDKLLLSRGEGTDFWYPGGGGWRDDEDLRECGAREVKEETGLDIEIIDLIYVQEFYMKDKRNLELFFLARPKNAGQYDQHHKDQDEDNRLLVEENKWFTQDEVAEKGDKVFPEFIRDKFWEDIRKFDIGKQTYYKAVMV